MIETLSTATTQTAYYVALLKLTACIVGFTLGTVLFMGMIYLIVFYSHYWK